MCVYKHEDSPLASFAVFKLRHAMMTRAPRLAKSLAVSLPIPLFAPVTMTVLPSIFTFEINEKLLSRFHRENSFNLLTSDTNLPHDALSHNRKTNMIVAIPNKIVT